MAQKGLSTQAVYREGQNVLVNTESRQERAFVIEKKHKSKGCAGLPAMYKIKTLSGVIRWVTENMLHEEETAEKSTIAEKEHTVYMPKFMLPEALREVAAKDAATASTRKHKKPKVPASKIFAMFCTAQKEAKPQLAEEIKEGVEGIKEMFVYLLHTSLLCKEEREHYTNEIYPDANKILDNYGIQHIVRMLISLHNTYKKLEAAPEVLEHAIEYVRMLIQFLDTKSAEIETWT